MALEIFVGLLLIFTGSINAQQSYQSSLFKGVPGTILAFFYEASIPSGTCKQEIEIIPDSPYYCFFGKDALEVIVLDYEPYAGIEFDSKLNTATIIRKPGNCGCNNEALVYARYSCGYDVAKRVEDNDWIHAGILKDSKVPVYKNRVVKIPAIRPVRNAMIQDDDNAQQYAGIQKAPKERVQNHAKEPESAKRVMAHKILPLHA